MPITSFKLTMHMVSSLNGNREANIEIYSGDLYKLVEERLSQITRMFGL